MGVSYYMGDLKRNPSLENYPPMSIGPLGEGSRRLPGCRIAGCKGPEPETPKQIISTHGFAGFGLPLSDSEVA